MFKKALIIGIGVSGKLSAEFLSKKGCEVIFYDDNHDKYLDVMDTYPVCRGNEIPDNTDVVIVSPGIPLSHTLLKKASVRGIEVIGEMELAARFIRNEKCIAVTGTNGKSTTVSLIADLLSKDGYTTALCGNIGTPLIAVVEKGYDFLVIEISSFQLDTLFSLHPDVACILNVSPDHLDRYDGFDAYLASKMRLAFLLKDGGLLIINGADEPVCEKASLSQGVIKYFSISGKSDCSYSPDDEICLPPLVVDMRKTALRGAHNAENVMAAILAVSPYLRDSVKAAATIEAFEPLRHRMEYVTTVNGVDFIDDSKGTNTGAVEKSLAGFAEKSVVLILGGVDKGGGYQNLKQPVTDKCRAVVLIGEAAKVIREELQGCAPLYDAGNMKEAVDIAYSLAGESATVLLSPACSSFDWYGNYKERGDDFAKKAVCLKEAVTGER